MRLESKWLYIRKVIQSCKTLEQLNSCARMVGNFNAAHNPLKDATLSNFKEKLEEREQIINIITNLNTEIINKSNKILNTKYEK